jgi:putative DNA-invertase from lambdoid prophage Rac
MASAAKRRPTFEAMMADAAAGRFTVLVVWAIDRFGRSMMGNLQDVTALDKAGVAVVSVREPWLDTAGPTRGLLLAIFSWVAEQERARLIERTKAGIARARASGKAIGRPKTRIVDVVAARALLDGGASVRACSRAMGVPLATLQRALLQSADADTL